MNERADPIFQHSGASAPNPPAKKRGSACNRCRSQKIRCDGISPRCSNCVKAGTECAKTRNGGGESSKYYIQHLEKRTRWLEELVRKHQPDINLDIENPPEHSSVPNRQSPSRPNIPSFSAGPNQPVAASPATSSSSHIGPSQPLAHDVGLLSLANSTEPKYLGPSSGVTFARLIFAAAPQSQGISTSWVSSDKGPLLPSALSSQDTIPQPLAQLPMESELRYFVDAYFEVWQPLYPFLNEESFQDLISHVCQEDLEPIQQQTQAKGRRDQASRAIDLAQLFLVLALGAKVLESRLGTEFSSDQYHATAMYHIGKVQLHDNVRGVQVLLLLVLISFCFPNGLNAWFLISTIIASCLDLGLQRKHLDNRLLQDAAVDSEQLSRVRELRSAIFWSAYSLERSLSVILGRPLTLRDEAIDVEYPGEYDTAEIDHNAVINKGTPRSSQPEGRQFKRARFNPSTYDSARYSFRFDRITAEIKLMLYRVAQSPSRFPWPSNLVDWQQQTQEACKQLLQDLRQDLKWRGLNGRRGLADRTVPSIELKYHQCVMLLYRPSPAIPEPSIPALKICYESALETIKIQSDLHRFANMVNSWLTAHAIFVSGITMLYALWTSPQIRRELNPQEFSKNAESCARLLAALGKTWSVALNAHAKFERLVQVTIETWKQKSDTMLSENPTVLPDAECNTDNTGRTDFYPELENLPLNFWDDYSMDQGPSFFMDELGDMGSWFDLNWLENPNGQGLASE